MRKRSRIILYSMIPVTGIIVSCVLLVLAEMNAIPAASQMKTIVILNIIFDFILLFGFAAFLRLYILSSDHATKYEHQAYTDAMTQVKNRSAFDLVIETLGPELCPNLTLIMTDLNTLKQVNDTMGHLAGDKMICSLVHYLEQSFGSIGSIYRFGGDEFVIVIENSPIKTVQESRAHFDQLIHEHGSRGGLNISVAIGIASRQEPLNNGLPTAELLRLADLAMYQHKATQKHILNSSQPARYQSADQIDAVTGILTFSAFKTRVYEALAHNTVNYPYLVNFDLNFFDGYNTLFGWEAGNRVLQKLTILAFNLCGKNGFCGHGDADTFWVFADHQDLDTLIRKITDETRHFQDQLGDFLLFPSFGIYSINNCISPVSDMCSHAINAKRKIKGRLDTLYSVYTAEDQQIQIDSLNMTASLRHALEKGDFLPFFQPKFSHDGTQIIGAEALARWRQEDGSFNTPNEFRELYEKSGLILSLDWHILKKTCAFLRSQLDAGRKCVPISVNFSRLHVYEEKCAVKICRMVDDYALPHDLIEIELTETALVQRIEPLAALISSIRANGFSVALDNFGRGFSSLGLLKSIVVDTVKIDSSLTAPSGSGERDHAVVSHLVSLCHKLGIRTVAEGIETETQRCLMGKYDFDMLQGTHLSHVVPAEEFERLLGGADDGQSA